MSCDSEVDYFVAHALVLLGVTLIAIDEPFKDIPVILRHVEYISLNIKWPDNNMFTRFQAIIPLDVVLGHPAIPGQVARSSHIKRLLFATIILLSGREILMISYTVGAGKGVFICAFG